MTFAGDKVKILVVGDSGVGKTSLVHLICHGEINCNPAYTIGCSVEVKLHEYKAGTPAEKTFSVDLWDVGASSSHQNSRAIFYGSLNGIIIVHDLTNRKSHNNLRKWLAETVNKDSFREGSSSYDFDNEQFAGLQIPILMVGTKSDIALNLRQKLPTRASDLAEELGAEEINLSCHNEKHLAPGSSNAVKLSRFFDKVIERKFHSREVGQYYMTPTLDKRRIQKPSHVD